MRLIKKIVTITLIFITSSSFGQRNLKEYYYPIGTKKEVQVYKYVEKNDPEHIEYKKITTNPKENTVVTESYLTNFWRYNSTEEKLNKNGTKITLYANFYRKTKGDTLQINGKIIEKNGYKWNNDNEYKYSVEYNNPNEGNERLIRGRIKISLNKIMIQGTEYETVKFLDQYEIKSLEYGRTQGFYLDTYFAKDVGIVKYKENYLEGEYDFELSEIISEKEFNKLIENFKR